MEEYKDESDTVVGELELAIDIIKSNRNLYNKLCKRIGVVPMKTTLAMAVTSHKQFLIKLMNANGKIFTDLEGVLQMVNSSDVILNLFEYNLYAAFTDGEYYTLMNRISNYNDDNADYPENLIKFDMRQIILKGWPQKLIILCNNNATTVEKLAKYAGDHFKCKVNTIVDDAIANIIINDDKFIGDNELDEKFITFINYVKMLNKDLLSKSLVKRPEYDQTYSIHYFESKLDTCINIDDIEKVATQILSIRPSTQIFNIMQVNINGNNNNVVVGDPPAAVVVESSEDIATKWINANPPKNKETKKVYYDRYITAHNNGLNKIVFGKLMKTLGYKFTASAGVHYWIAKK